MDISFIISFHGKNCDISTILGLNLIYSQHHYSISCSSDQNLHRIWGNLSLVKYSLRILVIFLHPPFWTLDFYYPLCSLFFLNFLFGIIPFSPISLSFKYFKWRLPTIKKKYPLSLALESLGVTLSFWDYSLLWGGRFTQNYFYNCHGGKREHF